MSAVRRPRVKREAENCKAGQQQEQTDILSFFPEENQPLLATNTGVRLTCTLAAMLSPFALFLCWAEKESRVIRRYAVQSVALACAHLLGAAALGLISFLTASVPYFGFLASLMGWLIYIAAALAVLFVRVKLMERAWHGRKFDLPMIERLIRRYY